MARARLQIHLRDWYRSLHFLRLQDEFSLIPEQQHVISVSVLSRHLEMIWPMPEHRVHGEHGGCGLGEGNGVCVAGA